MDDGVCEPGRYKRRPVVFALLLVGAMCMGMGQTVVFAVIPPIGRQLGWADFQVGAIFMTSAVFWTVMGPRWGRLSDAYGRRLFVLLGMGGFAVSMALFAASMELGLRGALSGITLYVVVLGMRSVYGFIGSAHPPAAQAYIADRTSPEERAKGLAGFSAALGLGATVGPALAGAPLIFGPLTPLYGVCGVAVLALLLVFFFLPENNPPRQRLNPRHKLSWRDKRLAPFLLFALVSTVVSAVPIQMMGFFLIDMMGLTTTDAPSRVGLVLALSSLAALSAQLGLVQAASLTPAQMMRWGPIFLAIGHCLFLTGAMIFPENPYRVYLTAAALNGLGVGLVMPGHAAAASLSVTPAEQGAVSGFSNAATAAGFIVAPPVAYSLYAIDPRLIFMGTALAASGLIVFAWRSAKIRRLTENAYADPVQ